LETRQCRSSTPSLSITPGFSLPFNPATTPRKINTS
jgi:hypothetical protein